VSVIYSHCSVKYCPALSISWSQFSGIHPIAFLSRLKH
jgi:hypothetical protein